MYTFISDFILTILIKLINSFIQSNCVWSLCGNYLQGEEGFFKQVVRYAEMEAGLIRLVWLSICICSNELIELRNFMDEITSTCINKPNSIPFVVSPKLSPSVYNLMFFALVCKLVNAS